MCTGKWGRLTNGLTTHLSSTHLIWGGRVVVGLLSDRLSPYQKKVLMDESASGSFVKTFFTLYRMSPSPGISSGSVQLVENPLHTVPRENSRGMSPLFP